MFRESSKLACVSSVCWLRSTSAAGTPHDLGTVVCRSRFVASFFAREAFRGILFFAEPVASGVVVKSRFHPILTANSLTIRMLDRIYGPSASRGSERLANEELRSRRPSDHPLADLPAKAPSRGTASKPLFC